MTTSRTRAVTLLITALVVGIIVGGTALTMAVREGKADFVFRGLRGPGRTRVRWSRRWREAHGLAGPGAQHHG
ncbi:MAG: hypothetical protein V9E87_01325 [Gemmatimonadales bacterium]